MSSTELFEVFTKINDKLDVDIAEISVKQHQLTILFDDSNLLYLKDIPKMSDNLETSYITTSSDSLYLVIPFTDDDFQTDNEFGYLVKIIREMAEQICACPSLEYVLSDSYIKCFLDKPGLYVSDLAKYETIMDDKKGTLELFSQRPYLLFVNTYF